MEPMAKNRVISVSANPTDAVKMSHRRSPCPGEFRLKNRNPSKVRIPEIAAHVLPSTTIAVFSPKGGSEKRPSLKIWRRFSDVGKQQTEKTDSVRVALLDFNLDGSSWYILGARQNPKTASLWRDPTARR